MKKGLLIEEGSLLSDEAKKNLAEIERLLNQSHKDLKDIENDLVAIKDAFDLNPPSLPLRSKIIH